MSETDTPLFWAEATWPQHPWREAEVHEGAFHRVLTLNDVVARISKRGYEGVEERTERERQALRCAQGLPFPVPAVLSEVSAHDGHAGFLTTKVPGTLEPDAPWSRMEVVLREVLPQLQKLPVAGLPETRAWAGGKDWPRVVSRRLLPLLGDVAVAKAKAVVAELCEAEQNVQAVFVHGDLGAHNVLWDNGAFAGVIDFDHASAGDPAIDVAPSVGVFGQRRLRGAVPDEVLDRAVLHRATLPLQVAAAAWLVGDRGLRNHALDTFSRRVDEGSLFGPPL